MRGSHTGELVFDNVEVPAENVLVAVNGGAKVLMSGPGLRARRARRRRPGIMQAVMDNVALHPRPQTVRPEHRRVPAHPGQGWPTCTPCCRPAAPSATPSAKSRHARQRACAPGPKGLRERHPVVRRETWMAGEASRSSAATATSTNTRWSPVARRRCTRSAPVPRIRRMLIGRNCSPRPCQQTAWETHPSMTHPPELCANRALGSRTSGGGFSSTAGAAAPRYLWISCADSRVPANQDHRAAGREVRAPRNVANGWCIRT